MRHAEKIFYMMNPALDRELDTGAMVQAAIDAVSHDPVFSRMMLIDPFKNDLVVSATITVTFPDPELLSMGKVPEQHRAEVLRKQQMKILNAIDVAHANLKTGFVIEYANEDLQHAFSFSRQSGASQRGGEVLVESSTASVTLMDYRSVHMLQQMLERLLAPDQLQLARDIALRIDVQGHIDKVGIQATLFEGRAARKPVPTWLTLDKKATMVRFFSVPVVAHIVADACRGFLVSADKANAGAGVEKRRNIDDAPISISEPGDVLPLVEGHDLFAFYPAIDRDDGSIGRLVCDLDNGKGFVSLLGQQRAWEACCRMSDAITACATSLDFPMPARKFSGSRGIHVAWNVEPSAFHLDAMGQIANPAYTSTIKAVEKKAGNLESLKYLIQKPGYASKAVLEALVVHSMYTAMQQSIFDPVARGRLGIAFDHLACTTTREDTAAFQKVVVDCQPLVYRWMSPHHKSGRVARSIVDVVGEIRAEFRKFERVQYESEVERVIEEIERLPERYVEQPGFVPAATIEAACAPTALGATIAMVLARGAVKCCTMSPAEYQRSREWFVDLLENKKKVG